MSELDDCIDTLLGHLNGLASPIRRAIWGRVAMLSDTRPPESLVDKYDFYLQEDQVLFDKVQNLFYGNDVFRFGSLIRVCALLDHVYLASPGDTIGRLAEAGANEVAKTANFDAVFMSRQHSEIKEQLEEAASVWHLLRQTQLGSEKLVELEKLLII